jgi:hypothetical protein
MCLQISVEYDRIIVNVLKIVIWMFIGRNLFLTICLLCLLTASSCTRGFASSDLFKSLDLKAIVSACCKEQEAVLLDSDELERTTFDYTIKEYEGIITGENSKLEVFRRNLVGRFSSKLKLANATIEGNSTTPDRSRESISYKMNRRVGQIMIYTNELAGSKIKVNVFCFECRGQH